MTTSNFTTTTLEFLNGVNVNAQFTASNETFSLFSTTGAFNSVNISNCSNLELIGDITGNSIFQAANSNTTADYTIFWPDSQGGANEVLTNDGAGNLTWDAVPSTPSAGNAGDIQYSDGAGNFVAATLGTLNYTDGTNSTLEVGAANGDLSINGVDSTLQGSGLSIASGDTTGGTNIGGNLFLIAGAQTSGAVGGDGGNVFVSSGASNLQTSGNLTLNTGLGNINSGDITLGVGNASTGDSGSLDLSIGTAGTNGGSIGLTAGQGGTDGGSINFTAGDGTGNNGGSITFGAGVGGTNDGSYEFYESGTTTSLVSILSVSQNATSTSTGTVQIVSGGLGVASSIYTSDLNATATIGLEGSISGNLFTQSADTNTAAYGVIWPNAQATSAGEVLTNDGAGNLSWTTPSGIAAGNSGDIQLSDGAGNFIAATSSLFNFTDGSPTSTLNVGVQSGTFNLFAADGSTLSGCDINVFSGDGGTGSVDAGALSIATGQQTAGTGDGGILTLTTGDGSTNGGNLFVSTGDGSSTNGGLMRFQPGTGGVQNGIIEVRAADVTNEEFFLFQDSTGGNDLVRVYSVSQNATSTSTGTVRVTGGLGVTQSIYANEFALTTNDTLTQQSGVGASYTVIWPGNQATTSGEVLTNDGAGNLSWATPSGVSAGNSGDIQLSDGAGNFVAATTSFFNFTDAVDGVLTMGTVNNSASILGANSVSPGDDGVNLTIAGGEGIQNGNGGVINIEGGNVVGGAGTGDGGSVNVTGGACSDGNGGNVTLSGGVCSGGFQSGDITLSTPNTTSNSTDAGTITLNAGNATGTGANGGSIVLSLTSGSTTNGDIIFDGAYTGGTDENFFFRDSVASNIIVILSGTQNATSTSTGTMRITGGLGVTQDIFADNVNIETSLGLEGSTSGDLFTQSADANTAAYSVIWPSAQASTANEVLANDGAGNLSWADISTFGLAAGNADDIQYNDGSDNFAAATLSTFQYDDAAASLRMGLTGSTSPFGIIGIIAASAGSLAPLNVQGMENTTAGGDGGGVNIIGGPETGGGAGSGGDVLVQSGSGVNFSGDITIETNSGNQQTGSITIETAGSSNFSGDVNIITGNNGNSGAINLTTGGGGNLGGDITMTCGNGNSGGNIIMEVGTGGIANGTYQFVNTAGGNCVEILNTTESSTSVSTGTMRVSDGLGVNGDIYAANINATTTLGLEGSVSGNLFTQAAEANTAAYGIVWPAAQGGSDEVLRNDGAGNLTWVALSSFGLAAGNTNDIQYNDGSDNFAAATNTTFQYDDSTGFMQMGRIGSSTAFGIQGITDSVVGSVARLEINGMNNTSGFGGAVNITGGSGVNQNGGEINLLSGGSSNDDTGDISIATAGGATSAESGKIDIFTGATSQVSGEINIFTSSATSDSGRITIETGDAPLAEDIRLICGSGTQGGNMQFTVGSGSSLDGEYTFREAGGGSALVTILGSTQTSTNVNTGTMRVEGGLGVDGDIYCTTVNAVSDVAMKKDFVSLNQSDCLNKVLKIRGFEYALQNCEPGDRRWGVLAQDLEALNLDCIVKGFQTKRNINSNPNPNANPNPNPNPNANPNTTLSPTALSVDYNGLIVMLIESIKELYNIIQKKS